MVDYGRDVDIGRAGAETVDVNVKVDEAIEDALKEVTQRLDEVVERLEKTHRATEFILGQEVE